MQEYYNVLRKGHILAISVVTISLVTVLSIDAQQDFKIPDWVKNTALWWGQGEISDADYISGISFLIDQKIIRVSTTQDDGDMQVLEKDVIRLSKENQRLKGDMKVLEGDLRYWKSKSESSSGSDTKYVPPPRDDKHPVDKKFTAGPFRFHLTEAGFTWGDVDGINVEFYQVFLEVTNIRGTSVDYYPSQISLIDSDGYVLQHEYTNGLKTGTNVPPGGKLSGYYTFEKPSSEYGTLTFRMEMAVYEDSGLTYNWHYSGETGFSVS